MTRDFLAVENWKQHNEQRMEQWCDLHDRPSGLAAEKQSEVTDYAQAQYDNSQQNLRYNSRYSTAFLLNRH